MRPLLTDEIFTQSNMVSSKGTISTLTEMNNCKNDGWSFEFYCDYLSQFFDYDSIPPIVKPHWFK